MNSPPPSPIFYWDIFCNVIDNFGDIGVCWRLAVNLAQRGQTVRLWVDDASALSWMAPEGASGVQVLSWTTPLDITNVTSGDVLVEAFGCEIAPEFVASYATSIRASGHKCLWINMEYLSAEPYVERCHGLPSPVLSGPGTGLTKHFFYPGFTPGTGGLLREADLLKRLSHFDRAAWLAQQGIHWQGERLVSLFCYEPIALASLLASLANATEPTRLLVTAGRAAAVVRSSFTSEIDLQPNEEKHGQLSISYLSKLTHADFDHLLWACELNFVRGEDSLVRALWAGKPLVWQIYPQDDDAHHAKLNAFLDWLQAPPALRRLHQVWNALASEVDSVPVIPILPALIPNLWQKTITTARNRLLRQDDLATALLRFVLKTH